MTVTTLLEDVAAKLAMTRQMKRKNVDTLLEKVFSRVSTLRKARSLFADQLAPDFRIFDYLRTDELGLSRCLVDLLDPQGRHGQKRLFLDMFLNRIGAADWAATSRCQKVSPEKMIDNGRKIDIYVEFDQGLVGIENKPWAGDQPQQLSDYAKWLKKATSNWILVFLSNREPDPLSITEEEQKSFPGHFIKMDYHSVIEWLEAGAAKTKALTVRVFIDELVKFIRTHVNGELDMSEELEIRNTVLASKENLEAAFLVAQSLDKVKENLISRLKGDLEKKLGQNYLLSWDFSAAKYSGFKILSDKQQNKMLRFEFDYTGYNGLFWGICKESDSVIKNQPMWDEIYGIMKQEFKDAKKSDWWMWYTSVSREAWWDDGDDFLNWGANPKPWQAILDRSLADKILYITERVYAAFSKNMKLLTPP